MKQHLRKLSDLEHGVLVMGHRDTEARAEWEKKCHAMTKYVEIEAFNF
jgi:hypothetical protein